MIGKVRIAKVASYESGCEFSPNLVNYIFGGNGSGKTTLTRIISDIPKYPSCAITWEREPLDVYCYNKDFVKENFGQNKILKGVFTLGKGQNVARAQIDEARAEVIRLTTPLDSYRASLASKEKECEEAKLQAESLCWKIKIEFYQIFKDACAGFVSSAASFFAKCRVEQDNQEELRGLEELKVKHDQVFQKSPAPLPAIPPFDFARLVELETDPIYSKPILGAKDLPIRKLIDRLNNSDWVWEGKSYLPDSQGLCPFCQQPIPESFEENLNDFFDREFLEQLQSLKAASTLYEAVVQEKINAINSIISVDRAIIDYSPVKPILAVIEERFRNNKIAIQQKLNEPSLPIAIGTLQSEFDQIIDLINQWRNAANEYNQALLNIEAERTILKKRVWKFLADKASKIVSDYNQISQGAERAKESLKQKIATAQSLINEQKVVIQRVEASLTSVSHTVSEINRLLELFGFTGFRVAPSVENGTYKIIRSSDGSDIRETLSEGEYNFITFLYFFHLLKGSTDAAAITKDRVVVIDDPISSLDSNVLFIVSNLTKTIIQECLTRESSIKQVFVLTHNVYFHKEVTFKGGREGYSKNESFWLVRKFGSSIIEKAESNPVQTTYEMLWRELSDIGKINTATVFNTMRRILEYYFNIIGDEKYDRCIDDFEGEDKIICKTLISWMNDGSHFVADDIAFHVDDSSISKYRDVFRLVFERMNHLDHYNMMMRKVSTPTASEST